MVFIIMNMIHVVLINIELIEKSATEWIKTSLTPTPESFRYEVTEVLGCLIFIIFKTDEDCFTCFNRNKAIMRYSIFQYNYSL